jgi:hypothetical protein
MEENKRTESPNAVETKQVSWHLWDDLYHEFSHLRRHIQYIFKHCLDKDPQYAEDANLIDMEDIIEKLLDLSDLKCLELWDKARQENRIRGPQPADSKGKEASNA